MRKMQALAARLDVTVRFRNEGRDRWRLLPSEDGGGCVLLDRATGECRIYEDRPDACRRFPDRPYAGCLLWPGRTGEDQAVGA